MRQQISLQSIRSENTLTFPDIEYEEIGPFQLHVATCKKYNPPVSVVEL
ncbi:MAG TPA: hypothetical protein VLB68_07345 [Pyrinomonadaceae bacterium]|nr:hypothetical protein [Pyrinomonadaceae bacterium]